MTDPMQTEREASLHEQIVNLPCKFEAAWKDPDPSEWIEGYVNGHRDTRYDAAELAAAYEAERASELRSLRDSLALAKARIAELEGIEAPAREVAASYEAGFLEDGLWESVEKLCAAMKEKGE
jgi:hypothetical protein